MDVEIREKINQLDLEVIINRMIKICRWSRKAADEVAEQYKRFLYLKKKYGKDYGLPPSKEIDKFWHNHILHTEKYHIDCLYIFGRYLHHKPDNEYEKFRTMELQKQFEDETQRLYFLEFGDYLYQVHV